MNIVQVIDSSALSNSIFHHALAHIVLFIIMKKMYLTKSARSLEHDETDHANLIAAVLQITSSNE